MKDDQFPLTSTQKIELASLQPLAYEAYLFGYPLLFMEYSRRVLTNVPVVKDGRAPMGRLVAEAQAPNELRGVDLANPDFVELSAWVDVVKNPMVLSVPNIRGRFYVISLVDAWGNIFDTIGTRATGEWKGNYALVPPRYRKVLPKGVVRVECPTRTVRMVGKLQCHNEEGSKAIKDIMDAISLVPLKIYGNKTLVKVRRSLRWLQRNPVDRSIITDVPPSSQLEKMDPIFFLQVLSELMKDNPPAGTQGEFIDSLRALGMAKDRSLSLTTIDMVAHKAIDVGAQKARADMNEEKTSTRGDDWEIWRSRTRSIEGELSRLRKAIDIRKQGALDLPEDCIGFQTNHDNKRRPLDGNGKYVLHFTKDQVPPCEAFWSLVLYDENGRPFANRLDRHSIGSLDQLVHNEDGSLDLFIQSFPPSGDLEANWLPAPMGGFGLVLNLYQPKKEGKGWAPPLVVMKD